LRLLKAAPYNLGGFLLVFYLRPVNGKASDPLITQESSKTLCRSPQNPSPGHAESLTKKHTSPTPGLLSSWRGCARLQIGVPWPGQERKVVAVLLQGFSKLRAAHLQGLIGSLGSLSGGVCGPLIICRPISFCAHRRQKVNYVNC
jgi:hypothetical protein